MKQLIVCLLALCLCGSAKAQTTNYYNRINHIFGAIDKTKDTTGYLKEVGVRFNEMELYNGTDGVDTLANCNQN